LLTATAAGTLLCALWFVPSANATGGGSARDVSSVTPASQVTTQARVASTTTDTSAQDSSATDTQLADTGSFDTTPYVIGGTLFLGVGAGFVVYSVRRERLGF
jgi:LPXTG-motif cell wall-anchored protein